MACCGHGLVACGPSPLQQRDVIWDFDQNMCLGLAVTLPSPTWLCHAKHQQLETKLNVQISQQLVLQTIRTVPRRFHCAGHMLVGSCIFFQQFVQIRRHQ